MIFLFLFYYFLDTITGTVDGNKNVDENTTETVEKSYLDSAKGKILMWCKIICVVI